eukprot:1730697-Pleurochrysis_carterae.AAC.1
MSPGATDSSDNECLDAMLAMSSGYKKAGVSAKERAALDKAFCSFCDSASEGDSPGPPAPACAQPSDPSMPYEPT